MDNITDRTLLSQLQQIRSLLIAEEGWALNPLFINRQNWAAVPIYVGEYLPSEDAFRLIGALQSRGIFEFLAVNAESRQLYPFRVRTTHSDVAELNTTIFGQCYLLTDLQVSFAILFTPEHYGVIAGSVQFVESVVGSTLTEARENFIRHVLPYPDALQSVRESLIHVHEQYLNSVGSDFRAH